MMAISVTSLCKMAPGILGFVRLTVSARGTCDPIDCKSAGVLHTEAS
jgi:hypothetical protein